MTQEQLRAGLNVSHDLSMLEEIKKDLKAGHWVGIGWSSRRQDGVMCFNTSMMHNAFEEFVDKHIELLKEDFEKI